MIARITPPTIAIGWRRNASRKRRQVGETDRVDAILRRDYPIIQRVNQMFSANYVIINLANDLSYVFFDPRIRY
jgi:hypothetical protein